MTTKQKTEYMRTWRKNNQEKCREYHRAYFKRNYSKNRKAFNKRQLEYYYRNKKAINGRIATVSISRSLWELWKNDCEARYGGEVKPTTLLQRFMEDRFGWPKCN